MSKLDKLVNLLMGDSRKCTTRKCYVNINGECCYVGFFPRKCSEANQPDHKPKWII